MFKAVEVNKITWERCNPRWRPGSAWLSLAPASSWTVWWLDGGWAKKSSAAQLILFSLCYLLCFFISISSDGFSHLVHYISQTGIYCLHGGREDVCCVSCWTPHGCLHQSESALLKNAVFAKSQHIIIQEIVDHQSFRQTAIVRWIIHGMEIGSTSGLEEYHILWTVSSIRRQSWGLPVSLSRQLIF